MNPEEENQSAAPEAQNAAAETATATTTSGELTEDTVWDALRKVVDPELHYNIVDLGLVYGVTVRKPDVHVDMTLTSPGCPYGPLIVHDVKTNIGHVGADNVSIDIVWDPPWGPDKMSEEAKLDLGFDMDFDDF